MTAGFLCLQVKVLGCGRTTDWPGGLNASQKSSSLLLSKWGKKSLVFFFLEFKGHLTLRLTLYPSLFLLFLHVHCDYLKPFINPRKMLYQCRSEKVSLNLFKLLYSYDQLCSHGLIASCGCRTAWSWAPPAIPRPLRKVVELCSGTFCFSTKDVSGNCWLCYCPTCPNEPTHQTDLHF